ncbi:GNAT family N-acetyltransferase [Desertimonas flava]|uniref:GNAT family N-acetyltransferase n=1 Tax=Desertimonas flava TaxID=2064846 RepID=UPI000E346D2C|nr:GNAT family N-acetyltransferase [Desertimonas flava]
MHVREFVDADWPAVWPIVRDVIRAEETFPYDPAMTSDEARSTWVVSAPGSTVVADDGGSILGTAHMQANRGGRGAHVATASFMVAAHARGRGVGRTLCSYALDWARRRGFAGMQFNAVVETNEAAIRLYRDLGFSIVGTVPGAFDHPTLGRVGLHVMYREL